MDGLALLLCRVNRSDYPLYAAQPRSPDRPGLLLLEARALQGVRHAAAAGYALALLRFYAWHRPRLPFADRRLARLHHFLFPSAALSAPLGAAGGLLHGAYADGCVGLDAAQTARAAERERQKAAAMAAVHSAAACEELADPCGVLRVGQQVPAPNDAAFYRRFGKERVDALVSAAMRLQQSPEEQRWLHTAGRLGGYGIIGALLTWNNGGMMYRLWMGLGLGVVVAAAVSATGLDA